MTQSDLPPNVSCAAQGEDGRMHAPAAERNAQAVLEVVQTYAPKEGRALELASGTGQHAALFAQNLPRLIWQPSDVEDERLASIEAWRETTGCANLLAPVRLDATKTGWGSDWQGQSLILVVNLLHLISHQQTQTLISEAGRALLSGGRVLIYGPFLRNGTATSAGDRAFDTQLRASNPEIGYKNDQDIKHLLKEAGLDRVEHIEMPANNLCIMAEMG